MKSKFFLAALAALALGACTDNNLVDEPAGSVFAGDKGYVSLSVNMPVQPSTKSANDNFADGTAEEYAVKNATLLLFAGASEATATYYAKYDLDGDDGGSIFNPADDQITARKAYTQEIDVPETNTDNIYALVLLNSKSILDNLTLTKGTTTLSDLTTTAVTVSASDIASSTDGFFMSNSPLFNKKGGTSDPTGGEVSTLVLIDANNIYGSAAEAAENPAADIYVEHAVAKVTVEDETNGSTSLATNNSTVASVSILGYTLDLTNNSMYPVRNTSFGQDETEWWGYYNSSSETSASDKYRFVGGLEVGAGLWRTYWGKDPNYDSTPYYTDETTGERVYMTSADDENYTMSSKYGETPTTDDGGLTALKDDEGNENPTYCLENTFNVAHMNKAETTRAIIAVQITLNNEGEENASNDFYIINDHKSKVMTEDDVKEYILEVFESYGAVEQAQSLWSPTGDDADADLFDNVNVTVTTSETSANATIEITFGDAIKADNFSDSKLPDVFDTTSTTENDYTAAMEYVNSEVAVAYYKGGISYYPVMIEHFGDESTPWSTSMVAYDENNTDYDANISTSYPEGVNSGTAENNWLGRWGVLRNNWYEIDVTDVVEIGSPTVPEAQDEPDDPTESWINVEINILSWVKRQQSVGL
ncbi:MAG: Mfa1 fimbrilin C-terminal domain-containing protein [Prevotellaceae bacterium]|nr:Mfa1 fimbrilin C-terminal domain-containing protein [Prevotellaceae bacterium]